MKYIFITFSGLGYPIAYKLQEQGYEVLVGQIQDVKEYAMEEEVTTVSESDFLKEKRLSLFKGLLDIKPADKVIEIMKTIKNPHKYFIFFEENNLYRWADKIRDLGFEGNFPTKEDYLLEVDRESAKEFVKAHYAKLNTPEVKDFDTIKEALHFLSKTDQLWVLKGKDDHARTFVPDTEDPSLAAEQIKEVLLSFPQQYEKKGFILELFIPSVIELTPERMYYDGVPLLTTVGIENKPIGSGNISVQTGCAEDLVFAIDMEDRINKIAFPDIVDEMARQHKGLFIWDASILINRKDGKMYFGEFCSNRPGYNSFFTELSQAKSINDFFENIVHKIPPIALGTVASSVRIFNMNRDDDSQHVSSDIMVNYRKEITDDVWLWDVRKNSEGNIVSVGSDWNLAIITGSGKSIEEAVNRLYKNVSDFAFVGAYYRSLDDYVSLDYSSSIINRLNYGIERGLYKVPFDIKVGDIRPRWR